MKDRNFIKIDGFDSLGRYCANYGGIPTLTKPIPVFKVMLLDKHGYSYNLLPGYLDIDEQFYFCPLRTNYVKINLITIETIITKSIINSQIDLTIFNKDFSKNLHQIISFERTENRYPSGFMDFNNIINFLNEYIADGNELDELDFDNADCFSIRSLEKEEIIKSVNNLKLDFYENSIYRPGKDDYFWVELEITNLPENSYLKEIMFESLQMQSERFIEEDGEKITVQLPSCDYGNAFRRRSTEMSQEYVYLFTDILKMNMLLKLNHLKYSFTFGVRKTI